MSSRTGLGVAIAAATTFACSGIDGTLGDVVQRLRVDAGVRPALPALLSELPAQLELTVDRWSVEPAFSALSFDDPVALLPAPRSDKLFVLEREGRVYSFDSDPNVTEKTLALDLTALNQGNGDSGLLGLAFHPEFGLDGSAHRGFAYLHYTFTPTPIVGERPPEMMRVRSRLSRFTVDPNTWAMAPASELILIDQGDDSVLHQGGALFFRETDGFLYLTVGDEGGARCSLDNCQRIDKDLFAGVLRIDVDARGGDVSHPIVRQPQDGVTAHYYIPNDNPFVGQPGVLEEFYAIGLRSPHRMTYDAVDDLAWLSDVGQGYREELNVLAPGANYQWPILEGTHRMRMGPAPQLGVWTDPVHEFKHPLARSIIGGYVYRGSRLPELRGRYIFGDFVSKRIWALTYAPNGKGISLLKTELLLERGANPLPAGITSFGVDADGELFVLTLGAAAQIQRLVSSTPSTNAPLAITQSADEVVAGLGANTLNYAVQSPLWSDGAHKDRWMAVPPGQKVAFAPNGAWEFPAGTLFAKHFAIALDERRPDELTPLETRFLVATPKGQYYGLTYEWSDERDHAEVVLQGRIKDLSIVQADGSVRTQRYELPGPSDCLVCHNARAGYVLGARTEQLNRPREAVDQRRINQLGLWSMLGVFETVPNVRDWSDFPRLPRPDDERVGVEDRVRSYWAGNCSMCHGVDPEIRAHWDARYSTPLADQGVLDTRAVSPAGPEELAIVTSGDPNTSSIFHRSNSVEATRMPPLGRREPDAFYLDLLKQWIMSLEPSARR